MSSSQFPSGSLTNAIFDADPCSEYGSIAIVTFFSELNNRLCISHLEGYVIEVVSFMYLLLRQCANSNALSSSSSRNAI